jgi:hypothetical protein
MPLTVLIISPAKGDIAVYAHGEGVRLLKDHPNATRLRRRFMSAPHLYMSPPFSKIQPQVLYFKFIQGILSFRNLFGNKSRTGVESASSVVRITI